MFPTISIPETVVKITVNGYNIINLKCWISCYFEPTFTLNGIPISPSGCQAPLRKKQTGEGKRLVAVTHLALLGVKIQEPAFWEYISEHTCINCGKFPAPMRYNGWISPRSTTASQCATHKAKQHSSIHYLLIYAGHQELEEQCFKIKFFIIHDSTEETNAHYSNNNL